MIEKNHVKKSMENSNVIVEFVKGFLKHRFEYIEHELFKKVRELMDRSPLMELIKDRHLLRKFQYYAKKIIDLPKINLPLYFEKVLEDILKDFTYYRNNLMINELPIKLFEFIQEPTIQEEGIILNLVFNLIDLMNREKSIFKESDLENIIEIIIDGETNPNVRAKLFKIFKSELYSKRFDSLIPIIENEAHFFREIKLEIIKQLASENPRYSRNLKKIEGFIIDSYQKSQDMEYKELLEKILLKSRKICNNPKCKAIINLHKDYEEILACNSCGEVYCETCQKAQYSIRQCDFCNASVCVQHYMVIDSKNESLQLCELCRDEDKYQDGQIICDSCRKYIKKCNNEDCRKLICIKHYQRCFICNIIYCIECAKKIIIPTQNEGVCPQCKEYVVSCSVCGEEIYIGDNMDDFTAYQCDDCGKYLCIEHRYGVADWGKNYCKDCMESWKDYVWQMETEGH